MSLHEQIQRMWTAGSSEYDEIVAGQLRNRREVAHWQRELRIRLGAEPLDVIDAGCGPGFFSIMLARLGHRVTAIDSSEGMVEAARRNVARESSQARVRRADVVALDGVGDSSVDAIVSRDVVWTLYDPAAAYRRWLEVLRPGGVLLVYDGDYRSDRRSLMCSAWFALSRVLVRVTDGRPNSEAGRSGPDPTADLPAVTTERPALDVRLLREAGFVDIEAGVDRYRTSLRNLEYWKYGYQGRKFTVVARTPS